MFKRLAAQVFNALIAILFIALSGCAWGPTVKMEPPWTGKTIKLTLQDYDSKALKGTKSLVIVRADQRDAPFTTEQFADSFRFSTGAAPGSLTVWPQADLVLDGPVTGMGVQSGNRARAEQGVFCEFVLRAPGYAVIHIYRSTFARADNAVNLRASRFADVDLDAFPITELQRPTGRVDATMRHMTFDGQSPSPRKVTLARLRDRAIAVEIHTDSVERLVAL